MFILDANRYARDPGGVSAQIPKMVEDCGGTLLASRLWNEQKLAYPIEGHRKGTYWLTYFRMPSDQVVKFNRTCQLNDNVLRNLTLKVEPRLVDVLVSHARGETAAEPEGAAESGEAAEAGGEKTEAGDGAAAGKPEGNGAGAAEEAATASEKPAS
jgi:small subunit ribosomal protein S6